MPGGEGKHWRCTVGFTVSVTACCAICARESPPNPRSPPAPNRRERTWGGELTALVEQIRVYHSGVMNRRVVESIPLLVEPFGGLLGSTKFGISTRFTNEEGFHVFHRRIDDIKNVRGIRGRDRRSR